MKTSPIDLRETRIEGNEKQKRLAFDRDDNAENLDTLLKELKALVYETLGLDEREQALVHDLVHVKLELNDGKVGEKAVRLPRADELKTYTRRLKKDLDAFIEGELEKWHQVSIVFDKASASGNDSGRSDCR